MYTLYRYTWAVCTQKNPSPGDVHFVKVHVGCLYQKDPSLGDVHFVHVHVCCLYQTNSLSGDVHFVVCTGTGRLPVPQKSPTGTGTAGQPVPKKIRTGNGTAYMQYRSSPLKIFFEVGCTLHLGVPGTVG